MNTLYEWKWSLGEGYYKSARTKKDTNLENNTTSNYESSDNAIKQSLADDTGMISTYDNNNAMNNNAMDDKNMISITNSTFSRAQNESGNRREELDNKMSGRDLTLQRGTNPFMGQTSYVNDVVTRDMFLKPINTTQGLKNKSEESQAI